MVAIHDKMIGKWPHYPEVLGQVNLYKIAANFHILN